jgi:hypothetical protein
MYLLVPKNIVAELIKYNGAKLLAQLADTKKVTLSTCFQTPTHMIKGGMLHQNL